MTVNPQSMRTPFLNGGGEELGDTDAHPRIHANQTEDRGFPLTTVRVRPDRDLNPSGRSSTQSCKSNQPPPAPNIPDPARHVKLRLAPIFSHVSLPLVPSLPFRRHLSTMSCFQKLWSDNPNAPKIPPSLYHMEKAYFAGTLIGAVLYGTCNPLQPHTPAGPCSLCLFGLF